MGKHGNAAAGSKANRKLPFLDIDKIMNSVISIFFHLQHLAGCFQIDFTCLGGMPICSGTMEKRNSKLFFKLQKLLVQGYLIRVTF